MSEIVPKAMELRMIKLKKQQDLGEKHGMALKRVKWRLSVGDCFILYPASDSVLRASLSGQTLH